MAADKPYTLLVVVRSEATLAQLARALGPEGFALRMAPPGPDIPRLAASADLTLLCLEDSPVDGPPLMRRLCAPDAEPLPPLVVLAPQPGERLEALRLGAEALAVPWDEEELLARLQRCLRQHQRLEILASQVGELRKLSNTDGLTELHNHRYFQERLREEFRRAQRYDDALALILLDLDHFKAINDAHGHMAGDGVLRLVAAALQRSVRETDLVARYGGEEFAVLLPRTHLPGALTVAERIARELGSLSASPGDAPRVTASLGVSAFPHRAILTPEQLVHTADEALYRAKAEGRNRICLHAPPPSLTSIQAG